jgi:hypothetical protein
MNMAFTETAHTAEFLISEGNGRISRDAVTIDTGALVSGTVLGKITASGKYVILAPAAVDGSAVAAGILYEACDATAADQVRAAITRLAEVNGLRLTWPAGITSPEKAAAIVELAARNIIVR